MATYLMLFRFTGRGTENIKDSPARVEAAKEAFRAIGAHVKEFYLLMGTYDTAFVVEAPDDETIMKASLNLGSQGSVRTETFRAFTEDEYKKIIADLI
ncbi:MAG: GYD domain-containing protein [Dehalococcoidia bacterium]|nr:MAG: GYD domain-containing protein [Dehalococcoidia bacterium]